MAKEERLWSNRHSHESSTVSYGHFGTPTYHESSQEWTFLRNKSCDNPQELNIHNKNTTGVPEVVGNVEPVAEPHYIGQPNADRLIPSLKREFPEIGPVSKLNRTITGVRSLQTINAHESSLTSFGSALCLDLDGSEAGNVVVPVMANVVGAGRDGLQITCLGKEKHNFSEDIHKRGPVIIPSLEGRPKIILPGVEPILQASFSRRDDHGQGDTFLCVRRASHTSIFEPLLRRAVIPNSFGQTKSSLDLNLLVRIDPSVTGGGKHVDVGFHPLDHRWTAIIDEEGNWSTWKLVGRKSPTARVLYHLRLKSSGKIFAWSDKRRPESLGLYFDGWHKVLWTSSDGQGIDRLLVCNRQMIRIFNLDGNEVTAVDPRLDTQKVQTYILDIRSGPTLSVCLVLTTSRILIFDMAQTEWKDSANRKGPALLCAYQHFHNPADLTLKMTSISDGRNTLVYTYCATSAALRAHRFTIREEQDGRTAQVSDAELWRLPTEISRKKVQMISLFRQEIKYHSVNPIEKHQEIVRVLVQHYDLSTYTFLALMTGLDPTRNQSYRTQTLKFPPSRSLQHISQRLINDKDDDEDLAGFIGSDPEHDSTYNGNMDDSQSNPTSMALRKGKNVKYVANLVQELRDGWTHMSDQQIASVDQAMEELLVLAHAAADVEQLPLECMLLSDILQSRVNIEDIEDDSTKLQQALSSALQVWTSKSVFPCQNRPLQSFLNAYNSMFNIFIESLPPGVPDRFRVEQERESRGIVFEQCLSYYTVRRDVKKVNAMLDVGSVVPDSTQDIFSDPIQRQLADNVEAHQVSASQPTRQVNNVPSESAITGSQEVTSALTGSLNRLSYYTKISQTPRWLFSDGDNETRHVSSLLSHLPMSSEADPDDYDYEAILLSLNAGPKDVSITSKRGLSRAQRRADRLQHARGRAKANDGGTQSANSGDEEKSEGNGSRRVNFLDELNMNDEQGTLPIRSLGLRHPNAGRRDTAIDAQHQLHHASDGYLPLEEPGTETYNDDMPLTQPERGVFANRIGASNTDARRKKKKRVAGF